MNLHVRKSALFLTSRKHNLTRLANLLGVSYDSPRARPALLLNSAFRESIHYVARIYHYAIALQIILRVMQNHIVFVGFAKRSIF